MDSFRNQQVADSNPAGGSRNLANSNSFRKNFFRRESVTVVLCVERGSRRSCNEIEVP